MSAEQHEALRIADHPGTSYSAAAMLRASHALIVQMGEALEVCKDTFQRVQEKTGVSTSAEILAEQSIAAATQYLKGPKT